MKLRLEGTPAECEQVAQLLARVLDVVSVSAPYPNRGRNLLVRVYVEVRPDPDRISLVPAEPDKPRRPQATLRRLDRELPTR